MSRPVQVLLFFVVMLVAAVGGYFVSGSWRTAQIDGDRILGATFPDLSGTPRTIGSWKGKVLVVNFWATWCPPCLEEIPMFVRLQRELGQQGLQFVGIAVDRQDKVAQFVAKNAVNYPIMIGQLDAISVAESAGNDSGGLPYTLVFDRQGQVVSRHYGGLTEQELRPIIQKLL
jgi:thiol-disulfide isomerase/thioredoxin